MKTKNGLVLAGFVLIVLAVYFNDYLSMVTAEFASLPWWMYFVLAGILYSGYKFVTMSREEHDQEQEWIEQEGNVYMKRMEAEKEKRQRQVGDE